MLEKFLFKQTKLKLLTNKLIILVDCEFIVNSNDEQFHKISIDFAKIFCFMPFINKENYK